MDKIKSDQKQISFILSPQTSVILFKLMEHDWSGVGRSLNFILLKVAKYIRTFHL